jgi:hypothetical protein
LIRRAALAEWFSFRSQALLGRSRLDPINEFARQSYAVRITCTGWGNVSDWNAIELMRELHRRRISLAVEEVERRVKRSIAESAKPASSQCARTGNLLKVAPRAATRSMAKSLEASSVLRKLSPNATSRGEQ